MGTGWFSPSNCLSPIAPYRDRLAQELKAAAATIPGRRLRRRQFHDAGPCLRRRQGRCRSDLWGAQHDCRCLRQGRRRQIDGGGESGGGPGQGGGQGRAPRRRRLWTEHSADDGSEQQAAGAGRQDRAARSLRRQSDEHRLPARPGEGADLAWAAGGTADYPVSQRRPLGGPRLPGDRLAARHGRRAAHPNAEDPALRAPSSSPLRRKWRWPTPSRA